MWQRIFRNAVLDRVRSYTSYSPKSNSFGLYKLLAGVFAIHYDTQHRTARFFWNVYRILPLLVNVSYYYKTYRLAFYPQDNTATAAVVASVWGFTSGTLRIIIIETRYGALQRIMSFLNDRKYRMKEVEHRRAKLFRKNNRILLALVGTVGVQALWFLITQLFAHEAFMLQINGQVVSSVPVQIVYGLLSNVWAMIYVLSFAVFYITMNIFRLEMVLLLDGMSQLEVTIAEQSHRPLDIMPPFGETSNATERRFWTTLQRELNRHIVRHIELLDHLRELSSIIGPFSFVQYYGTFALIAGCGFILAIEGLSTNGVIYMLFAIGLVFESFLICHGIEQINDLNAAIGQALYSGFHWPMLLRYDATFRRQYQAIRHSMLLVIRRSQKGFQCSFGGLGGISMERFAQLMQKSYSLLTLLLQFAK